MFGKFKVWYNPIGIANAISLKTMSEHYHLTHNSDDMGGVFTVHTPNGKVEFIHHPQGLHNCDLSNPDRNTHGQDSQRTV